MGDYMDDKVWEKIKEKVETKRIVNFEQSICPDQLVAVIECTEGKIKFVGKCRTKFNVNMSCHNSVVICERIDAKTIKSSNNLIVLVLESPHKDEFSANWEPVGPAYGKTGDHINRYLPYIISESIYSGALRLHNELYDVVLINAVPKMCSLGYKTQMYRDAMFLNEWEKDEIRNGFYTRLNDILEIYKGKHRIIINCCTQGKHDTTVVDGCSEEIDDVYIKKLGISINGANSYKLNDLVGIELKKYRIKYYTCTHPYSWMLPKIKID